MFVGKLYPQKYLTLKFYSHQIISARVHFSQHKNYLKRDRSLKRSGYLHGHVLIHYARQLTRLVLIVVIKFLCN